MINVRVNRYGNLLKRISDPTALADLRFVVGKLWMRGGHAGISAADLAKLYASLDGIPEQLDAIEHLYGKAGNETP